MRENAAAHVIREGTTNILRHATASWATITVHDDDVTIRNDGVDAHAVGQWHGLAALAQRVRQADGVFDATVADGRFELVARFGNTDGGSSR